MQIQIKLINLKGIINIGGPTQTVFKFARQTNKKTIKISAKKMFGKNFPLNQSMNISKYTKFIKSKL